MTTFPPLYILITQLLTALKFGTTYVSGLDINSTIYDDQSNFFTWTGSWHTVSSSNPCWSCDYQPDPQQLYNQTWHDGGSSADAGGFIEFTGSEIYIFGADTSGGGAVTFSLDGVAPSTHTSTVAIGWQYNVLFFSATDVDPSATHKVTFSVSVHSAVIDYAMVIVYTPTTTNTTATPPLTITSQTMTESASSKQTAPPPTNSNIPSKRNQTTIIVLTIAVVVTFIILLIIAGIVFILRRKRQQDRSSPVLSAQRAMVIHPFTDGQEAATILLPTSSEHDPSLAYIIMSPSLSPRPLPIPSSREADTADENEPDSNVIQRFQDIERQLAEIRRLAGRDRSFISSDDEAPPSYHRGRGFSISQPLD